MAWASGDVILRREVVNDGRAWLEFPVIVVLDHEELLATYVAGETPLRYPPGLWPTPDGLHPWHPKERWHGHGVLMLQRPGEAHAIWVFWDGPEREFHGWYVNIQEPFRRTALGYDTQDLELDIWVPQDGPWQWKDAEVLEQRVREGRYRAEQLVEIRAEGERIAAELDAGRQWWDESWASWAPDSVWGTPSFEDIRAQPVTSARANSGASNGRRSSSVSPTPISFTGRPSS